MFFHNCAQMVGGDLFAAHTGQLSPSEAEERQQTRHQTTDNRQQEKNLSPWRYREVKSRGHGGAQDFCSLGNIDRMQWNILVILWYFRCCSQFHHQPTCGGPVYSCCCFTAQFSARQMEDKNTGSSAPHLKYHLQTQVVLLKQLVSPNQLWKAIFIIVENTLYKKRQQYLFIFL